QASTYRDIVVVFQLNSSPWTNFGYKRIPVSAGSSTLNIPITIDANTPIASGVYKFVVFIVPTSGGWYDRFDTKTPQNSVSCIPAPDSASDYQSFSISLNGVEAELLLKDKIDPLEIIEFSSDLATWTPVARNYGDQWETVFPHAHALSAVSGSTDQAMVMEKGEKGFYRKSSTSTINANSNRELASRFLMQATFGPSRAEIDNFPNINSNTFGSEGDGSFLNWIDAQIAISPFYHRAYWRERSDPDYIDESSLTGRLVNEVGHNPAYGQQFSFSRGQTVYRTDWTNPLPGYGGLFDINGDPIDENHPLWISATHFANFQGNQVPLVGLHSDNCATHIPGTGLNRYEISYPVSDTRQMVWYKAAIDAPDQLRQRVAWALSQYFVVAELGNNQPQAVERWLNYYDIFTRHAFGNFRDILDEVTWSPHMGYYLSHIENRKANPSQGTYPDENYAREVMQLFTIGLWELNEDGTRELDVNGNAIPTYDNDDIFEFAKVFTGMRRPLSRGPNTNIEELSNNYIDPMRVSAWMHDFTTKTLLDGTTLGPFSQNENGVRNDVAGLLDHLFNHKNVPPFFARFMIQRFTISNPSPAYIEAVALAFKNGLYEGSGSGNRGCMEATIKAVLLHPEARSATLAYDPSHGKLREPLIRLLHVARAFGLTSNRTYGWLYFKDLHDTILQAPYESPSVFNYYRPDYAPNGVISDASLNAPEFQIHNDVSALQLSNALTTLIVYGIAGGNIGNIGQRWNVDSVLDFTYEDSISNNTPMLIDHLDLILCAGRLTSENRSTILAAANTPSLNLTGIDKVKYIAGLIVLTPEFNTLY
ncbi:MAG: DUF1800 family protein, partial [Verrucomicrobiota bacterium]|nr:DUF1800 family protein [Verrucomicrobiota bacterium]